MRRPRGERNAPPHPGGDGAPPGATRDPCEELADSGPLCGLPEARKVAVDPCGAATVEPEAGQSGLQKARPGAEMRTPRWRAERRHVSARARALKPRLRRSARRPPHIEGEERRKACPGPYKKQGR